MYVVNDNNCGWINDLNKRSNIKNLNEDRSCDWLIIGAGYTGLSAARKLSELNPNQKIMRAKPGQSVPFLVFTMVMAGLCALTF